jgi:hypothetical protein
VTARLVKHCGLCGRGNLRSVLHLGSSPPTCVMPHIGERQPCESFYPLEVLFCDECALAQLSVSVEPRVVFPPEYPYQSGNSGALHDNFQDLAGQVTARVEGFVRDDLVVDIGANDGTLLSKFDGCRTVGVEPTRQAQHIQADFAYRAFFDAKLAERIVRDHGQAKVVTACNVLAHVEDLDETMQGIDILLADDGVLVAENHDLKSVVDGQWDTVYHEHLRFWSPYSFWKLLDKHGFGTRGRAWQQIDTHGGSFRVLAVRGPSDGTPRRPSYDFKKLGRDATNARAAIRKAVATESVDVTGFGGPDEFVRVPHGRVVGIGATARATTIINYCGLDVDDIRCVCEVAGSDKIGRYIPGTRIPVVDETALFEEQPDALLFSWHLADVIVPRLRERGFRGKVIVPLPVLRRESAGWVPVAA